MNPVANCIDLLSFSNFRSLVESLPAELILPVLIPELDESNFLSDSGSSFSPYSEHNTSTDPNSDVPITMTSESIRADTACSTESRTEESSSSIDTSALIKCDKDTNKCTTGSDDNNLDVDMLGPYNELPSSRPTMISSKYRQKEERRKVLKVSMTKLRKIDDPESSLRRSVLINNTVKRLQREYREEKLQKYHNLTYSSSKCFGISSDFITKQEENYKVDVFSTSMIASSRTSDQLLDITNLPDGKTCVTKYGNDGLGCDEAMSELAFPGDHRASSLSNKLSSSSSRKRNIDETLEECDVLSQFCLPPTPRSIPCSELHHQQQDDDDEEVNVVDIDTTPVEPLAKRKREDCGCESTNNYSQQDSIIACCLTAADRLRDNSPSTTSSSPSSLTSSPATFEDWITDENIMLQTVSIHQAPPSPYSCGQASIMNEIITYTNLIASFES